MIFLVNLQRCPQISELKVPCRACRSCFFRSSIIFNAISFSVSAPLRPPLSTIPVAHVLDVNYWRQPTTAVKVPSPTTPRSEISTKQPPCQIVQMFNSLWVWFFSSCFPIFYERELFPHSAFICFVENMSWATAGGISVSDVWTNLKLN